MKHFSCFIAIACLIALSTGFAISDEMATKDECVEKCHIVADLITNESAEAAIRQVNDVNGPFVWKDTYVYIMDMKANIVAHGPQPKFIGKNLMALKDPITQTPWYPALFQTHIRRRSERLVRLSLEKPGAEGIYTKDCYFEKAGDLVVFAGIYGEQVK